MYEARDRVRKCQEEGTTIAEWSNKCAKSSAGNIMKAGTNRLGKVIHWMIELRKMKEREQHKKINNERQEWAKAMHKESGFIKQRNQQKDRW